MKKQLLATVIAAAIATPVMANITITGNAKFEYFNVESKEGSTKSTSNQTRSEVNLNFRGKTGDTEVVLDLEVNTHGSNTDGNITGPFPITTVSSPAIVVTDTATGNPYTITSTSNTYNYTQGRTHPIDVENAYLTTKLGPIGFKGGSYKLGNGSLLGEIELNSRRTNRFELDYTVSGVKVYTGNEARNATTPERGKSVTEGSVFFGAETTLAGWKLHLKRNNSNKNSFGVSGKAGPVGIRFEYSSAKAKKVGYTANDGTVISEENKDTYKDQDNGYFLNLTAAFSGINLGLATVKVDGDGGITEDDSDIFAQSNGGKGNSNTQLMASTTLSGIKTYAKVGEIGFKKSGTNKRSYWEIGASRTLASGATVKVDYGSTDTSNTGEKTELEIDVSIKF